MLLSMPREKMKKIFLRLLLSIIAAYPASGIVLAFVYFFSPSFPFFHNLSGSLIMLLVRSAWFAILTPMFLGFPISDEAGVNHINMYPYIIPTALVIFFVASKGWRWFKPTSGNRTRVFCALTLLTSLLIMPAAASTTVAAQPDNVPHEVRRLKADGYINAVAWNADGTRLAALSDSGLNIRVWDSNAWKVVSEFQNPGASYMQNSLAFLPDGSILTTPKLAYGDAHLCSLVQWNPDTGKPVREIPDVCSPDRKDGIRGITNTYTTTKEGSLIAGIIPFRNEVMVFDGRSGTFLRALKTPDISGHPNGAMSIAFSPDGQELAEGTLFGAIHFFNPRTGDLLRSVTAYDPVWYGISSLAYSADGRYIAAGKYASFSGQRVGGISGVWVDRAPDMIAVTVWRVNDDTLVSSLPGSVWKLRGIDDAASVRSLSWSPNGNTLVVGDDLEFRLWNIGKDKPTLLLDMKKRQIARSTAFSPQGILAITDDDEVALYR